MKLTSQKLLKKSFLCFTRAQYSQTCIKRLYKTRHILAFQTGGCLLLNESSADSSVLLSFSMQELSVLLSFSSKQPPV